MSQNEQELRSGLDGVPSSAMAAFEPPVARDPRVRYLFFGGDMPYTHTPQYPAGGLWVESRCVSNQICQRCDITPVTLHSPRAQVEYIPDGMGIPGTESEAGHGPIKLALQQYYEYPAPVVTNLLKSYSDWGLVELDNLKGYPPATVKNFRLREFFFPEWPKLPKSNQEVIDDLQRKLDLYSVLESLDPEARVLICTVGEKMLRAVERFQNWMQGTIDETHGRFTLGGEDRDKKRRYDRLDILALERTGTARRDNELNLMARQSNSLAQALKDALLSIAPPHSAEVAATPSPITDSRIEELIKATEAMHETLLKQNAPDESIISKVAMSFEAEDQAATGEEEGSSDPAANPGLKIGKKK